MRTILQSKKNYPDLPIILFKYEHIYIQKNLALIISAKLIQEQGNTSLSTKKKAPYKQLTHIRKALTWGKKLRLLIKKLFNKLTSGISRNNMIAMS